jgi:hypothetical protein
MLKARHLRHPVQTARIAAILLRLHAEAVARGLQGIRYYKEDSRFRLDAVTEGFRNRPTEQCDRQIINRICDAYRAASSESIPEVYQPTNWWKALRSTSLRQVLLALEAGDLATLERIYANFLRDSCSDGLMGKSLLLNPSLPQTLVRAHQRAYLNDALSRLDRWKALTCGMYELAELQAPTIGNPFGIVLGDIFVSNGAEHQHYCAQRIASILNKPNAVVAEIGGGYGAMAYYLLRDNPGMTYYNFDTPESLALSAYYLIQSFPEKRILLYGEPCQGGNIVDDYDIVLLPLPELTKMPSRFADMIFSAHAMSDLGAEALRAYLERVKFLANQYFLYQCMDSAAKGLLQLMADESSDVLLRQERRYHLHGQKNMDCLQCELLYELARL